MATSDSSSARVSLLWPVSDRASWGTCSLSRPPTLLWPVSDRASALALQRAEAANAGNHPPSPTPARVLRRPFSQGCAKSDTAGAGPRHASAAAVPISRPAPINVRAHRIGLMRSAALRHNPRGPTAGLRPSPPARRRPASPAHQELMRRTRRRSANCANPAQPGCRPGPRPGGS